MARRLPMVLATVAAMTAPAFAADGSGCQCLYQGKSFNQGEVVCIRVDGRARLARCGMLLNNSAWQFTETSCPTAMMSVSPPGWLASLAVAR